MTLFKQAAFYLILLLSSTALAFTSEVDDAHPFTLSFVDESPVVVQKDRAEIDFLFRIPKKHYLYRHNLKVEFDQSNLKHALVKPGGVKKFDDYLEEEIEVYYHQLMVLSKLQFDKDFDYSKPLTGRISYQGCSERICFKGTVQEFEFRLNAPVATSTTVTPLKSVPQSKPESQSLGQDVQSLLHTNNFKTILGKGLWFAVLLTFLAGILTSLTPCVLPVIPLTLAFIGVRGQENKSAKISHLLVFVLGMVAMYASLGVLSAYLGQTLGFLYQSQIFLLVLVVFFILMGLWMFGLLNFNLPTSLQTSMAKYQPKGFWRYFYSGLTVGFLAAPCVGPILGPLLVYIASTQDLVLGFVLMLSYALGLSLLFVALGFVSSKWIGKFGQGSNVIKKIFGVLLFAVAAYYIWVLAAPFLNGPKNVDHFFKSDYQVALVKAQKEHKGVIVDFFAEWCLPCHKWDNDVWSNKEVQEAVLKAYVPVKIDCTKETPQCQLLVEKYKVIGWPTILFIDAEGNEIVDKRLVGQTLDSQGFLEYLPQKVSSD